MTVKGLDFKPIDPKEIPKKNSGGRPSRYLATVAEFIKSGAVAVEIDRDPLKKSSAVAACLRQQVVAKGLGDRITVINRAGRVFLLRTAS